jgi:hypothetical protein
MLTGAPSTVSSSCTVYATTAVSSLRSRAWTSRSSKSTIVHAGPFIIAAYVAWSIDPTPWAPATMHGSSVSSIAASTSLSFNACQ